MGGYYLVGQTFCKLTVVDFHGYTKGGSKLWDCLCECGNKTVVSSHKLIIGHTKSCGCLHRDLMREMLKTHGGTNERLYKIWWDAKRRCEKPYDKSFKWYGGRGIQFFDEWRDYSKFREWALANGYEETAKTGDCTLDRIDVNGNYCPENCRWVPMSEQRYNCQNTIYVELNGEKYNLKQLSDMCGIPRNVLCGRIRKKWTVERAISTPYEKRK